MVPTPVWEDFSSTPFGEKCPRKTKVGKTITLVNGTTGVKPAKDPSPRRRGGDSPGTTPPRSTTVGWSASSAEEVRDDVNVSEKKSLYATPLPPVVGRAQQESALTSGQDPLLASLDVKEVFWCDVAPPHKGVQVAATTTTLAPSSSATGNKKKSHEKDTAALGRTSAWIPQVSSFGSFASWMSFGSGTDGGTRQPAPNARTDHHHRRVVSQGKPEEGKKAAKGAEALNQVQHTDIPTHISLSPWEFKGQQYHHHPADDQESLSSRPISLDSSVSSGPAWHGTNRQTKTPVNRSSKDSGLLNPMGGVVDIVDVIIDWTLEVLAEEEESEAETEATRESARRRRKPRRARKTTLVRDSTPKDEAQSPRIDASKETAQRKPTSSTPKVKTTTSKFVPNHMNLVSEDGSNGNVLGDKSEGVAGVKSHLSTNKNARTSTAMEAPEDAPESRASPDDLFETDPEKYAIERIASALSDNSVSMSDKVIANGTSTLYPEEYRTEQPTHVDFGRRRVGFLSEENDIRMEGPGLNRNVVSEHHMAATDDSCVAEAAAPEDGCMQETHRIVLNANPKCEDVEESAANLEYLCLNLGIVGDKMCGNLSSTRNQRRIACV